ncbi:MAG: hypothetical protein AMJ42_05835 [Deltaproteobacteria bacterium DG_8]|nr:MAG: hypothetical protein AMJ42_05835 [Deltaproteobacteria bacterium DG_8]
MIEGLNKETLKRLYIKEQKTTIEIAKMFGCSPFAILYRCKRNRIKLRPRGWRIKELDKSVLRRLYVKEGKSSKIIAEMFSCSPDTVLNRFREYGIPLRDRSIKRLTKALLQRLYVKEGKTVREIAKIVGSSREVVRRKCKQFGIPLRNPGSKKIEIDKSALRRLYVKEGKSIKKIAKIFNCSISPISKRVMLFGLKKGIVK